MKVKGRSIPSSQVSEKAVYGIISHAIDKSMSLQAFIEPLLTHINENKSQSGSGLVLQKMNDQQIMAQIQQKLKKHMRSVKKSLKNQGLQEQEMQDQQEKSQRDQEMSEQVNSEDMEQQEQEDVQAMQNQQQLEQSEGNSQNLDENQAIEEASQQQEQQEMQAQEREGEERQEEGQFEDAEPNDSQLFEGQDDVGLYGEQLDQQDMESYQNQLDKEGLDPQFQRIANQLDKNQRKTHKREKDEESEDNQIDNAIEDNFNQYREIQLENQKQQPLEKAQKTELDKKIDQLQDRFNKKKDWALLGQVKARERPVNSLLQYDLKFNSGIKLNHQISIEMNNDLQSLIKQRVLDELFDDRVRYTSSNALREHFGSIKDINIDTQKSKKGLAELYEEDFKNYLGLGQNKHDRLKKEIMDQFKQLNYKLDCLSNFNFIPRPVIEKAGKNKGTTDTIVIQEKIPITMWTGENQDSIANRGVSKKFIAEKEVDNQAKRLKNKRIARQRSKQQMKKKMNRKIEYGGMTKYEAQAKLKIMKNKQNAPNIKYNKSASFFKNMNDKASAKPNPNINKMKI